MTALITMGLLILFLVTGMPIAFAMAVSGAIGLMMIGGWDYFLGIAQTAPYETTAAYLFTTIPMFIFMAELLRVSDFTKDLFSASNKWLGNLPGGLGIATILAGAGLGAVSGSSTASAATLASSAVPEMNKYNYKKTLALGVASVSGTLAVLIPPSIALILFGILTETGIGSLLIAGIVPGLITVLAYVITILIWVKRDPDVAPKIKEKPTTKARFKSLLPIWPLLIIMTAVIGGIYTGIVTPTEAGGLGAFTTFAVAIMMRRLNYKKTKDALEKSLKSTAMIMTIMIGAMIFGYFLISTQLAQTLIEFVGESSIPNWLVFAVIVVIYLILGVFMDQIAILILTLPLTFPLVMSFGYDPIWFGIVVVKTVEIGLVTPPVGMNVFVAAGASGDSTTTAFRGVSRFVVADVIVLLLLILFPILSTWLPSMMMR